MTPTTRVRLYSGRLVHAARPYGAGHITACGTILAPQSLNHWLPDTTVVTCRTCQRKTGDAR